MLARVCMVKRRKLGMRGGKWAPIMWTGSECMMRQSMARRQPHRALTSGWQRWMGGLWVTLITTRATKPLRRDFHGLVSLFLFRLPTPATQTLAILYWKSWFAEAVGGVGDTASSLCCSVRYLAGGLWLGDLKESKAP